MRHGVSVAIRADEAGPGAVRADRMAQSAYRLAPPRRMENGTWRFEGVISTPGVNRYPHLGRVEYVTPESIRSDEYLEALVGLPLIDATMLHGPGVTLDSLPSARLGSFVGARWDEDQQATIVDIVVDHPRGIQRLKRDGIRGLSLQYTPVTERADTAPDGTPITHRQTRRLQLDHALLTPTPNDAAANVRADTGAHAMTPEALAALLAEGGTAAAIPQALVDLAVTSREAAAAANARADALAAELAQVRADSVAAATAAPPAATAAEWRDTMALAAKVGATIPDTADLPAAKVAIIGHVLPGRADSADPDALLALIGQMATKSASTWAAGSGARADSGADTGNIFTSTVLR